MARPLASGKKAVDLASGPRKVGSRIRRAPPPPPEKKLSRAELREREARMVVIGIAAVGLAVVIILFSAWRWAGWSPSDYTISVEQRL